MPSPPPASPSDDTISLGPAKLYFQVFVVSVFILYLEMLLIRWVATEIRVFAYFKNLTLIACFLGAGLGCLLTRARGLAFGLTFPLLTLLCATVAVPEAFGWNTYLRLTQVLGGFNEMPLWGARAQGLALAPALGAVVSLMLLFALIAAVFVPGGYVLGTRVDRCPRRLAAYGVNLAGSLAGILLFTLVSFLGWPPTAWFTLAFLLGVPLLRGGRDALAAALAFGLSLALLGVGPSDRQVRWSPYQKLETRPLAMKTPDGRLVPGGFMVQVNGTFYQRGVDLSAATLEQHLSQWPEARNVDFMSYNLPYRLTPSPERVMVVGAGTGNDIAAALRNGARHVDAVEIDPDIVEIGREMHPEQPYSDPRVTTYVDDARSFFRKTDAGYDLIVFGALDSHTLTSSLSNIRIDNYVYTVEAFREARELLNDGGMISLVFSVERDFIGRRLQDMLAEAFGRPPLVFYNREVRLLGGAGGGPTFFVDRNGRLRETIRSDVRLEEAVAAPLSFGAAVPLATDDWPYLYLERRTIPRLYLMVTVILVLASLVGVRAFAGEWRRVDPAFFLLGSAFLLIEVQSISKMALLFGTTWQVNAVIVGAVLAMILLANAVAARLRVRSLLPLYGLLGLSLVANLLFPFKSLLALDASVKAFVAGSIMSIPVFFAGLIFSLLFKRTTDARAALGSNLMGAIAGGVSESLSFVIGVNALGAVALLFYVGSAAWLASRGRLRLG